MVFVSTFEHMLVLLMLVAAGYVCFKIKIITPDFTRQLSTFVINVATPCLVTGSVMGRTMPAPEVILPFLLGSTAMLLFLTVMAFLFSRLLQVTDADTKAVYRFMLIFGNTGFIGFPVVSALFGPQAVFYASVFSIPANLLVFTVGVMLVCRGRGDFHLSWRILVSPCLLATYLAIILVYFQVQTPYLLARACTGMGSITIPASLLILGASLATLNPRLMLGSRLVYAMCAVKQLLLPAVIYALFLLSPLEREYAQVLTVLAAMPVATIGTMLCLQYNVDPTEMTRGTFLTTLLSVLTIPLITCIL